MGTPEWLGHAAGLDTTLLKLCDVESQRWFIVENDLLGSQPAVWTDDRFLHRRLSQVLRDDVPTYHSR